MRPSVVYLNEIARRLGRKVIKGPERQSTPQQVLDDYEAKRGAHLREFLSSDWSPEEYALRDPVGRMYLTLSVIEEGRVHMDVFKVRRRTMGALCDAVAAFDPASVTEAGSGTGRNLVWLAHQLGVSGAGVELSPSGAAAGEAAAERFGLDLSFASGDLTDPSVEVPSADVVFSVHALEQIPDAAAVIDKMVQAAKRAVVMIEPFPEYWPRGLAGYAHRLRAEAWDRLQPGSLSGHTVTSARLLPFGTTVNRASLVVIEKD